MSHVSGRSLSRLHQVHYVTADANLYGIGLAMNLHQPAGRQARQIGLTAERLAIEKFAVGQSVPRSEDPMLLRGHGRYTDDVSLPGQAYAVMVRSRNAHGIIRAHRHRRGARKCRACSRSTPPPI